MRKTAWLAFICGLLITGSVSLAPANVRADEALTADGDQDGVQLVIKSLKRNEGDTVTLRFRIVNNSSDNFDHTCDVKDPKEHDSCGVLSGVYLIDQVNKKKYLVVRDSDGNCLCATMARIEKDKSQNLWVTFPAPPTDTQKVTVVVPTFEPIDGVPVIASQ